MMYSTLNIPYHVYGNEYLYLYMYATVCNVCSMYVCVCMYIVGTCIECIATSSVGQSGALECPATSLASLGTLGPRATLLLTYAECDQSLMMIWL